MTADLAEINETTFCPDCVGERGGFTSGTEKCQRHKTEDVISALTQDLAASRRACEESGLAYETLVDECAALRSALAEMTRERDEAIHLRDLHWREVESLRERLDKEEEERGRQYGLRVKAEAEIEHLLSIVKEWLDGNARLGRPKSIADQRFLNGLNAVLPPQFTHWSGTATKPEEP